MKKIMLYASEETRERLRKIAEKEKRSMTVTLDLIIEEAAKDYEVE